MPEAQPKSIKNQIEVEKLLSKIKPGQIHLGSSSSTYNSTMFKMQNVYNMRAPGRRNIDRFLINANQYSDKNQ